MGAESSTERQRIQQASTTGILTLSQLDISSWSELCKAVRDAQNIRTMSLSSNRLRHAIPPQFLQLPLWSTLTMLDVSGNNLRCACVLGYDPANHKHCKQSMGRESRDGSGRRSSRRPLAGTPITLSTPIAATCLEVLNLSRNCLPQLPLGLCTRFPTLRKLICRGNQLLLPFPGGLVGVLGASDTLNSVDLTECGLSTFALVEEGDAANGVSHSAATAVVYPNLEEVLLDGNSITGTLSLAKSSQPHDAVTTAKFRFPKLKRVSVANPTHADRLEAVDPTLYTNAPALNSVNLKGHANEAAIKEKLSAAPAYKQWQERHAAVINKQLGGAGSAELM